MYIFIRKYCLVRNGLDLCDPGKGHSLHHVTRVSHAVLNGVVLFGGGGVHLCQPLLSQEQVRL